MGVTTPKAPRSHRRHVDPIFVRRVGETAWILRPTGALEQDTADALRDVFLEAVDTGAQDVVVDLSDVGSIAPSAAQTILALADVTFGRDATLWIAVRRPDGGEHALRAVHARGRRGVLGLSVPLDAALHALSLENIKPL